MSIIRVEKKTDYAVISNTPLNDVSLSFEARGLLCYLLAKPNNWTVRITDLVNKSPAGVKRIQRIIKELETARYITRERKNIEGEGRFTWETIVYETPKKPDETAIPPKRLDGGAITPFSIDGGATDGKQVDIVSTDLESTNLISTKKELKPLLKDSAPKLNIESPEIAKDDYHKSKVVVVDFNSLGWPLLEIGLTAGKDLNFNTQAQAETFLSHWLYGCSQKTLDSPVFYALSRINIPPDPAYLEIVKTGPKQIIEFQSNGLSGNKEIKALRKAGVHNVLANWIPELKPEPDQEPESEPLTPKVKMPAVDSPGSPPNPNPRIFHKYDLGKYPDDIWQYVKNQIKLDMPKASFDKWVYGVDLLDYDSDNVIFRLGAQNEFARDWINDRLKTIISKMLVGITARSVTVEIISWDRWRDFGTA